MALIEKTEIAGLGRAFADLSVLEKKFRDRVLEKAVRAGGNVVLKAFRQRIPKEIGTDNLARARAGLMRKAAGVKVKAYKGRGVVVAIVGIRRGFKKKIGTRVRGPHAGQPIYYDPAKVFHLIETGSRRSPAQAPLRKAVDATKDAAGDAIIRVVDAALSQGA